MRKAVKKPLLEPYPETAELPLSFAQQRFWFLNRIGGPNYNEITGLRFEGELDKLALAAALEDVVERHDTLRTVFPEHNGVPRQEVLPSHQARATFAEETTKEEGLPNKILTAGHVRFDLRREPPLRSYLFDIEEGDHLLVLVTHHIAVDGWSLHHLLVPHLLKAYHARSRGEYPDLPPVRLRYRDFVLWERDVFGGNEGEASRLAAQRSYWRETLAGLPEQTVLPTNRLHPAKPRFTGGMVRQIITRDLHASILELAKETKLSTFMVFLAGVSLLLSRLGCGTDLAVGTPISRRTLKVNEIVGCFANTLVMRIDTSGNPTFRELLLRVRKVVLNALANGDVPFEVVVADVNPPRAPTRNPLFQVFLAFQTVVPVPKPKLGKSKVIRSRLRTWDHSRFDLSFDFVERRGRRADGHGVRLSVQYSTELFDESTIERMVSQLMSLLAAAVRQPDHPIETIDFAGEETRRLLQQGVGSPESIDVPTAMESVAVQVKRLPDRPAVVCAGVSLSYGKLDADAHRVASYLRRRAIGPEHRVGIAIDRSVDFVSTLLGVMRSGATVVCLDPEHDAEYLRVQLDQVDPTCVLATSDVLNALPTDAPVVPIDAEEFVAATDESSHSLAGSAFSFSGGQAAYICFTNGRSGPARPVVITQDTLKSCFSRMDALFPLGEGTKTLSISSAGSDLTILEILHTLRHGGTVYMSSSLESLYPSRWLRLASEAMVSLVFCGPRAVRLAARIAPAGTLSSLKFAVSREPLTADVIDTLAESGASVVSFYGTCESGAFNLWSEPNTHEERSRTLLGTPLSGSRVYILDRHLQPVAVGVPGELYCAGAGVAQGYFGRPGMTAERFIADPYGPSGTRMVRTGDIARWRADGSVEFLARDEHQEAQERGIPLETVESVLRSCPDVDDAVAVVDSAPSGSPRLIAYVQPGSASAPESLRESLLARTPRHLVPEALFPLELLPLTPYGCIDRRALPEPSIESTDDGLPCSDEETRLCALFAELTDSERMGVHDDFFECGGHSLQVATLAGRVSEVLGMEVGMRCLYEAPTVSRLLERVRGVVDVGGSYV